MLKDSFNTWVEDPNIIKIMVQDYFQKLFKENLNANGINLIIHPHPYPHYCSKHILCEQFTKFEIWEAMKGIKPYEAPRPDGMQAIFYHKFWNVLGDEIYSSINFFFINHQVLVRSIKHLFP